MISRLVRYINNMDARAARTIVVSVLLFAGVALLLVMGRTSALFDEDDAPIFAWLQAQADSPWGLPATIVLFTLAAFVGAPQFVLIAAVVVAFGPTRGFIYSWIATMVSAAVDFQLARLFGASVLRRYGGDAVNRLSKMVGKTGFWSSLAVRIVPSAPFIVVNMAAGASHMSIWMFLAGTGVGIIPKTALVAFFGGGVMHLASGGGLVTGLVLGGVAIGWLVAVLWARKALRGSAPTEQAGDDEGAP